MKVLFLSDLHIVDDRDPLYLAFLSVLRGPFESGDRVVLAGDIFDLFVGNKEIFKKRYHEFLSALRSLSDQGVQVDYIEGNHDFQLSDVYALIPRVSIHDDAVDFTVDEKRFYVSHGDLANAKDYSYLALRSFYRSAPSRWMIKRVPDFFLEQVGKISGRLSKIKNRQKGNATQALRLPYHAAAEKLFDRGYDYVVMGHCHDLDGFESQRAHRKHQYVNVGLPRFHKSYLIWKSGDPVISRTPLPEF